MFTVLNKKSWRLLAALTVLAFMAFLFLPSFNYPRIVSVDKNENPVSPASSATSPFVDHPPNNNEVMAADSPANPTIQERPNADPANDRYAFVTFLCDDVMADSALVLVYSLIETKTKHDIVVLVLPPVSAPVRQRFEFLGARVMEIDQVKYPWDSSAARRKGYNKACRYSKLNLWNLTDYRKVVFLDADTMVVQSIDDLFERPQFSAAIDVGGAINTGVFVAEPSKETYDEIMKVYAKAPSYNRGDQGFLNWYFASSVHPLPGNYNLMIKFAHFSALVRGYLDKNTAKILHYTSETKPWNFFYLHHREWKENYEGYLFGAWKRNFRHMRASLQEGRLWSDDLDADWDNANRVTDICDVQLKKDFGRRYRYADRFSVLIYLTSPSIRINDFANLLRTYSRSKKVHRIYIIADLKDKDRLLVDPLWIESLNIKTPVETIASGYNSPNNRFIPPASLQTEAVLIADDNVLPDSVRSIDFLFETWADQKDAIVGHFISSHQGTAKSKIQYIASDGSQPSQYSMIRTQSMFLKTDYLYAYTCLLPEQIHQYLDKHPDCTEIAINMMASGTSATRPLFVNAPVTRLPTQRATGPDASEMSQCIVDLMPMFGGKNTLLYNNQVISLLDDH